MWYKSEISAKNLKFIKKIKDNVKPILDNPLYVQFTSHNLAHSERVIDILGNILQPQMRLSDDELTILLAAAYLHDIGMFIKKENLLSLPELPIALKNSGYKIEDLNEEENLSKFVVMFHNAFSFFMIMNVSKEILGLTNYKYCKEIALVAQGHDKLDINTYSKNCNINFRLLSALLKLANELDIDKKRIHLDKLIKSNLNLNEKEYWYNHLCINNITIKNNYIKLFAEVPLGLKEAFYQKYFLPHKQKYENLLNIFEEGGIAIISSQPEINESFEATNLFLKEEGLIDHIKEKYGLKTITGQSGKPIETDEKVIFEVPKNYVDIILSYDKNKMACIVRRDNKLYVEYNYETFGPYDQIINPIFQANHKKLTFKATNNEKYYFVIDGKAEKEYDLVDELTFSNDNQKYFYRAKQDYKSFVVINGDPSVHKFTNITVPRFSDNKNKISYMGHNSEEDKWYIVIDEVMTNPYEKTYTPLFRNEDNNYIYFAQDNNLWSAYFNGKQSYHRYDKIEKISMGFIKFKLKYEGLIGKDWYLILEDTPHGPYNKIFYSNFLDNDNFLQFTYLKDNKIIVKTIAT